MIIDYDINTGKIIMQQQINEWLKVLTEKSNSVHLPHRDIKYVLEPGRKYTKVVKEESRNLMNGFTQTDELFTSRSVHAFIDNVNGDIYKAAGWKTPAKNGARFNVVNDIEVLLQVCDPFGSYLYKNKQGFTYIGELN